MGYLRVRRVLATNEKPLHWGRVVKRDFLGSLSLELVDSKDGNAYRAV
jgi:hypothetical protein